MLDIHPILLIATAVVFLALIVYLNIKLYKPLFLFMQKRDADIENDLALVGANKDEVDALNAEADSIIELARIESAKAKEQTISKAKELSKNKLEKKRTYFAKKYAEFEEALAVERETLYKKLGSQTALFSKAITAKIDKI